MRPLKSIRDRSTATTRVDASAPSVTPRQKAMGIESVQLSSGAAPSPANAVRAARSTLQSASSSGGEADGRQKRSFPTVSGTGDAAFMGPPPVSAGTDAESPGMPAEWPVSPKSLPPRLANDRFERRSSGIGPLKRLFSIRSSTRFLRRPNAGGMGPVSRLRAKSRRVRPSSSASSGGMRPFKRASARYNPVTRKGSPPSLTPCQEPMGRDCSQLSQASPARTSRMARRVAQSVRNAGGVRGMGRQSRCAARSWSATV